MFAIDLSLIKYKCQIGSISSYIHTNVEERTSWMSVLAENVVVSIFQLNFIYREAGQC